MVLVNSLRKPFLSPFNGTVAEWNGIIILNIAPQMRVAAAEVVPLKVCQMVPKS